MKQGVMARARTINDLLLGKGLAAGTIKRHLEESGLHAHYAYPALALFSVSTAELNLWSRANAADELYTAIKRHGPDHIAILPDDQGHIGMLFSWDDRECITELYSRICNQEYSFDPQQISLGISNPYPHLSDLYHIYEQALLALKHRFYLDHSQPIYFSSIPEYASHFEYPEDREEEILKLLTSNSTVESSAIRRAIEGFYVSLTQHGPIPVNQVVDATLQLLIRLQLQVKSALGQPHLCSTPAITTLMQLHSLKEMEEAVYAAITAMGRAASASSHASDSFNRSIIRKAVALMEEEYDRASLHYVAEKVFITPAYLSSLFKSKMGVTFIEHLTRIRISNAKKLLKQTQLKNYEVAQRVGYQNPRYFSQIFKKKVGMSPSGFRDAN
ncbi:helix-turn-helix domain-containing protein [Paenibacillus xylaniclasticus]|uniref:helix-turn-helix domain-containing protein n=1 Tax=Paenibacillus xylaniclasticus TaxID=588083 RepID=UPI000FD76E17|nr:MULTISPECIES: helix-turn-helix domain-containing protein [Paenibacillus]GFN33480.1 hypothetical protein PCURB6_37400 [Paenibacillus curdlanolyticus]